MVSGASGLASEFFSFFNEVNKVGFSSTNTNEFNDASLCGDFFGHSITPDIVGTKYAVNTIGSPNAKRTVSGKPKKPEFGFPNFLHSSVVTATNF